MGADYGKSSKGMSIITEVVFLAVIISLIFLVYSIAAPIIYSMQVSSAFDQGKSMMLELDQLVQDVADQRKGGRRSIYVTMGAGTASLDPDTDTLIWTLDTDAMVVSPRSMQQVGNLIVGSNLDVMAYEGNLGGQDAYVLENQNIRAYICRIGSQGSPAYYVTSDLLLGVYNKRTETWMPLQRLEISIDNSPDSMNGTGYTELVTAGYALARGEVVAHINTSYKYLGNYSVSFALESGADFLIMEAEA
ncbi:MAG: hypothetical protein JXC85_04025 [Candidatus Aenigmarchaeota archaeon]|nr:hypothetical protein [Candidatus Aenigmarchaeota archaeon]